jgi:hypothetical protein
MTREDEATLFLEKRIRYYSSVEIAGATTGNVVLLVSRRFGHRFDQDELDLFSDLMKKYGCSQEVAMVSIVETYKYFYDLLLQDS